MIRTLAKRLSSAAFVAGLAVAILPSAARAQLITLSAGGFTINAQGYSASTLPNSGGGLTQAPGAFTVTDGSNVKEDSWGIFQITSILNGGSTVFTDNASGTAVNYYGIYYNSHDVATNYDAFNNAENFKGIGLKLDIYAVTANDANDQYWQSVFAQGPTGAGARPAINQYTGISNVGTLVFQSQIIGNLNSIYYFDTGLTNAAGTLGVTYNNLFNTSGNALSNLSFSLGGDTKAVPNGWSDKFGGPVSGSVNPVPEPSTYGLMGVTALAAVVGVRRRKQKSAVASV